MDVREASHPHEFKSYSTDRIRQEFLIQDIFYWIDGNAIQMNLIVKMRTCATTRIPYKTNDLPSFHQLAFFDQTFFHMEITSLKSFTMTNNNVVTMPFRISFVENFTISGRDNVST